jgi:predicted phage baseplate assembly protein
VEIDATYRVGNGTRGNVGAEALFHLVTDDPAVAGSVLSVRNPLPARGGPDPESLEHVRQSAPVAFRTLERAVTAEDYATVAERHPEVQRAQATLRWTGSWRTVFLTVDRLGGRPVDDGFAAKLREHLERYRMAGHDLEIERPRFVDLEVELFVCVEPGYFRSHVEAALREVLSNRTTPDGQRGAFHPDNFTFGQPVYLSRLYAAAQAVPGVAYVEAVTFQRLGVPSPAALEAGVLPVGRLEIARLDSDPSFPERGVLRLTLKGGR